MASDANPQDPPAQESLRALLAQVRAYIDYQRSTGVDAFPPAAPTQRSAVKPPPAAPRSDSSPVPDLEAPSMRKAETLPAELLLSPSLQQATTLDDVRRDIGDCQRCKLAGGRTNIVFGVGNPNAQLMFVGEGPGRDEDLKAEPFVGRAGQLLTEIITKGMKMRREDVYIANVIKCRPPENRNPEPDEISACQPFLLRQIEIIRPKVIVALGTFAAQTLLGQRTPISRLRGHWYDYRGTKLMPTLHPAYLLRNPADKRLVWEDIKMVLRELESPA
ncbi:MAG: uracil-DNA glycosylase [Deltaproteobacteria bacterium]|nr:uracil-DNA glycosylase [Deltaproteobacteria bacterium]